MVDPQKRQVRSCLEAAGLSSFPGAFEGEEGEEAATGLAQTSGSAGAPSPPAASLGKVGACGEGPDAEVRRQPRLSHESSMNVGDAPHPLDRRRKHARENVLDVGWSKEGGWSRPSPLGPARRCASNVLAIALGREAGTGGGREPSTKHLCYSRESGYSSDTSQHGGSSSGSLVRSRSLASLASPSRTSSPSPSAVGGLALERSLASPSPPRGGSSWMSPNRWGRKEGATKEGATKEDARRDRRAALGELTHQHRARAPALASPAEEARAVPVAPGLGRSSTAPLLTAPFRLPCDVASFHSTPEPDPSPPCLLSDSPPSHRLVSKALPSPPTPAQTCRFRRAFSLASRGPLARRLRALNAAVAERQKTALRSPWRQVHPLPPLAAGFTTDTSSSSSYSSSSDSSDSFSSGISWSERSTLSLGDSSLSPTPRRDETAAAYPRHPEHAAAASPASHPTSAWAGGAPVLHAPVLHAPLLQHPALPVLILPAAYPSGTTPGAASGKAAAHEAAELSSPKLSLIAQPRAARKLDFSGSSGDAP